MELKEILKNYVYPIKFFEDNQSTIKIANTFETKRCKHIDVKFHFIKDLVNSKRVEIKYISTNEQIADILTKAMAESKLNLFREGLNVFKF